MKTILTLFIVFSVSFNISAESGDKFEVGKKKDFDHKEIDDVTGGGSESNLKVEDDLSGGGSESSNQYEKEQKKQIKDRTSLKRSPSEFHLVKLENQGYCPSSINSVHPFEAERLAVLLKTLEVVKI